MQFLYGKINEQYVLVDFRSIDMYGRLVGIVYARNEHCTMNLNSMMVENGMAWFYPEYSDDSDLRNLECNAREKRIGLWNNENPMHPSDFRKMQKNGASKEDASK